MHKKLKSVTDCTGCMACVNACPRDCIDFLQRKDGFFYPQIDDSKCINCGKCVSVCQKKMSGSLPLKAVAGLRLETDKRLAASSGGVFSLLAEEILCRNGVVYGAAFLENFSIAHRRVDNAEDIKLLLGSKYAQSYIGDIYRKVKNDLDEGREVLFSGTPCQIFALKSFLGKAYDNLICSEVICHGVPSPGIWSKYFEFIQSDLGEEIKTVNFRDKSTGWHNFSLGIYGDSKQMVEPSSQNLYMKLFLGNHILRSACYRCEYATPKRNADITLGDCWGNETICPNLSADGGISVMILNTPSGIALYEKIRDRLICEDVSLGKVIRYNKSFLTSPAKTEIRKKLERFAELPVPSWKAKMTRKDNIVSLIRRVYNKIFIEFSLIFKLISKN